MSKPNILLILTDQQFAGALSAKGNPYLDTPNLDRLVHSGVSFDAAYCTFPVCTPSRGSFWTGLMPHQHGALAVSAEHEAFHESLEPESLGHLFRDAGYRTVYGGKWHAGHNGPECSLESSGRFGFEKICGFNDVALPGACASFFRKQGRDDPFLLVASFDDPHSICEWAHGDQPLWGELPEPPAERDCPPLPPNFAREPYQPLAVSKTYRMREDWNFCAEYDSRGWREFRWAYYRLIERVDARIGEILDALQDSGHADNTLIVFTSDHGEMHGAHQLHQKNALYEEASRIPFVFSGPLVEGTPRVERTPVSNGLDLMPTLCEIAGIDCPDGRPGRSLFPLIRNPSSRLDRESVFAEISPPPKKRGDRPTGGARMIRTERFKYVAYHPSVPNEQFFDLERDPGEMVNLADCSLYDSDREHHRALLKEWMLRTGDRFRTGHYGFENQDLLPRVPGEPFPVKKERNS